jgi:hypothetical protein
VAAGERTGQSPAVFGDFWQQAVRLASPPPYPDPPADAEQVRHITVMSGRAAAVMRRYVGDIAAGATAVRDGSWAHAITRAQAATTVITGALRQETAPAPAFPAGSFAARLDGYATALTYGRDLLHTHLATTADGERQALSDWAPVISSAPVTRALLAGLADHARVIAGQLDRLPLAAAGNLETIAAWQHLHDIAGQLRELDAAVQAAQWQAPVAPEHRQLLEAIPVNVTPAVQVPSPEATLSDLCAGIISTAQRANQARRELAARAAWSPELTADSMRHAAANYVVTSFNTETVYRLLASRARQLGYHALIPGLDAAAGHAGDGRRAWLAAARAWDNMVTDTRGYLSRPAAEAGHLALWTGRLAHADRGWTPARSPSHAARDPAGLAPGPAELAEVASAMHYAADSLARAASTDLDTIRTAASPGGCTSPPAACPRTMTFPGPTPTRPAPGSPALWPSTQTPAIPLRRHCARPVTSPRPWTRRAWCSAPPSRRRLTQRPHPEAALSNTSSTWAYAKRGCCAKASNWTSGPSRYWPRLTAPTSRSARNPTPRLHPDRTSPTRRPRPSGAPRRPPTSQNQTMAWTSGLANRHRERPQAELRQPHHTTAGR